LDDAEPNRGEYRKFAIRGGWGNDDYRSMQEVVSRYFSRRISEGEPLPDLVLIDGGLGQLNATLAVLDDLGAGEQPVASIAKREELVYVRGREQPVRLPRTSAALRLLQRARDEAHRFAIGYNRKLRQKRTIRSELSGVPGVGPARQRALLAAFGSVRGVRAASEEEIARLPGFGLALARTVAAHIATGAEQAGTIS
jgi:excinuclease ABC subunit C